MPSLLKTFTQPCKPLLLVYFLYAESDLVIETSGLLDQDLWVTSRVSEPDPVGLGEIASILAAALRLALRSDLHLPANRGQGTSRAEPLAGGEM